MMALSPSDAEKLARILGLCGSTYDGERANAAALAHKFLRQRNLAWIDVLLPAAGPHNNSGWPPRGWRDCATDCLGKAAKLSEWETEFLHSIRGRSRPLTERQADKLRDIATALGIPTW